MSRSPADGHPRRDAARREVATGLAVRALFACVGAIALIVVGVMMARHGIIDHPFPPFLADGDGTVITTYSGPWLAGAIGVGTVAGLLMVSVVTDLWRRRMMTRGSPTAAPAPDVATGTMAG